MRHALKHLLISAVTLAGVAGGPVLAAGGSVLPDRMEPTTPKFREETAGVNIDDRNHLGRSVDLNLPFTDTNGRPVKLGDYFEKGRPVILQLGYFNCPQLCDVVSKKLMETVKDLPLELGKDYSILYVSVDPDEQWDLGRDKKRTYVEQYGKPGAGVGWNFLVGNSAEIKDHKTAIALLAESIGFGYKKLAGKDEFSHPPMVVVLTGDGKISRYFYGFQFPTDALQKSIAEAGQGKVGPYVQQILVALCYHFDEYSGKYSFAYMRMMQVGGILTVLVVFGWLGRRWLRDIRAARHAPAVHS